MASTVQTNFRIRHSFGKINQIIDIPNLIDIQKKSYEKFLQANVPHAERIDIGLQGVFRTSTAPASSCSWATRSSGRSTTSTSACSAA
jgi:DNA-directed RNA polymerase beta subunit